MKTVAPPKTQLSVISAPTVKPAYLPPPGTEVCRKSTGEIVGRAALLVLLGPIYLVAGIFCAIPALVGGLLSSSFSGGFAAVYRALMDSVFVWISHPTTETLDRLTLECVRGTFMLDRRDAKHVQITVRVHLEGEAGDVERTRALAPLIAQALTVAPYFVDLQFVDQPDDYSNTIRVDRHAWPTLDAWNPYHDDDSVDAGDVPMMAHELMHQLGLPDEYEVLSQSHADLGFWGRFAAFFFGLVQPARPADWKGGIMGDQRRPPLARHWQRVVSDAT